MESTRRYHAEDYKSKHFSGNKTQRDMALEYMRMHGSITPLEALIAFDCLRLGARISDLREDGFDIRTDIAKGPKQYAIYRLEENNE